MYIRFTPNEISAKCSGSFETGIMRGNLVREPKNSL